MTRDAVLRRLSGFSIPTPKVLVEDQDVSDIIAGTIRKHIECTKHYDVLYPMFDADGSWAEVGRRLFDFCKEEIEYRIESTDWQWVSTPMTIMKKGYCDCKGYALFCAGVIDAMKRAGESVDWCFRFASYNLFSSTPHHVFVVINPKTDNIWLDPVLGSFNQKIPRPFWKIDERVKTCRSFEVAGIGYIPGGGPLEGTRVMASIGSQEQTLLDSIDEYTEGVAGAITLAKGSGVLNTICVAVIATASIAIPIIGLAMGVIKLASTVVSDNFGPGSVAARLLQDVASNPLTAPVTIVESLLKGRTFESDQYRAAQFHQFYVLGNSKINALNKVSDGMIPGALKWFIDRLGIFVSGAEHIIALTQSPGAYMKLYGVNDYTTMDQNRVNAAYNVASQYFVFNNVAGSWSETIGVYDILIATIAQQQNETVESAAMQAGYQGVYSSAATEGLAPVDNSSPGGLNSFLVPAVLIGIGAGILLLTPSKKRNGS
jgi:hypothetical protein